MKRTTFLCYALAVAAAVSAGAAHAGFAPNPDGPIRVLRPLPDGDLLVGGKFTHIGGAAHNNLARLNEDGSADESFVADVNGPVLSSARQPDGKILIGGSFTQVNGVARQTVARLNADGSLDTSFTGPGFYPYSADSIDNASIADLHLQADGKILIVSGDNDYPLGIPFRYVDSRESNIARLNADGSLDTGFSTFAGEIPPGYPAQIAPVHAAAVLPDGKILVVGQMSSFGQTVFFGRLDSSGNFDASFPFNGGNAGLFAAADSLVVQSDGDIILAGRYLGAAPDQKLMRFHADGSLDTTYVNAGAGLPLTFEFVDVALQPDGKLILAGRGDLLSDGSYSYAPDVARLNPDGSFDSGFHQPKATLSARTVAIQDDGRIVVAGDFTEIDGYARNNLARLGADGQLELGPAVYTVTPVVAGANGHFVPGTAQSVPEGQVLALQVQPDPGYQLDLIGGCDGSLDGNVFTTAPMHQDCTVTANFIEEGATAFTVTTGGSYGTFSPAGPQRVVLGRSISFTLTPNPGYYFSANAVSGCGGTLDGNVFTTAPITGDCTVAANFLFPRGMSISGTPQATQVGTAFAAPLQVRVFGGYQAVPDVPLEGVEVRFETPASGAGAVLSSASAFTDANGDASVTATANDVAGTYALKMVVDPSSPLTYISRPTAYFTLSNESSGGPDSGIDLRVSLSTEPPPACGDSTVLEVTPGTPVNYCFTITNRTSAALNYHSLEHSPEAYFWMLDNNQALYLRPIAVPARSTVRYNIALAATAESVDEQFTWTSYAQISPLSQPYVANAQTHLRIGAPHIQTPAGLSATAAPGQYVSRALAIGNSGTIPLDWTLDRAAPSAHFPTTQRWAVPPSQSGLVVQPPSQAQETRSASEPGQASGSFDVPAYGAMLTATPSILPSMNYVTFNANDPTQLVPVLFNALGTQGGDFIDDDFTKQYVLYTPDEGLSTELYVFDYATFDAHSVSGALNGAPFAERYSGLAWDRTTRTLFASSAMRGGSGQPCDEQFAVGSSTLLAIDPNSGQERTIGPIAFGDGRQLCVTDIAVSPGGLMYGIDLLNDALLAIDKSNGHAALIGSLGLNLRDVNSIDFDDATGTLYLAAGYYPGFDANVGGIYTIDLATGLAQQVGRYPQTPGYLQIDALSIARAGGACAYPGEISWLRFDVAGGSTAPDQQSTVNVVLDADGLDAGQYTANLCISSNDRARSLVSVPISFTVDEAGEAIFRDGFDQAVH